MLTEFFGPICKGLLIFSDEYFHLFISIFSPFPFLGGQRLLYKLNVLRHHYEDIQLSSSNRSPRQLLKKYIDKILVHNKCKIDSSKMALLVGTGTRRTITLLCAQFEGLETAL